MTTDQAKQRFNDLTQEIQVKLDERRELVQAHPEIFAHDKAVANAANLIESIEKVIQSWDSEVDC